MAILKLNLTQASETIPNGRYLVAVTEHKVDRKQGGEYPYVLITARVQEGQYAGFRLRDVLSLSPDAAFKMNNFTRAGGLYNEDKKPDEQELDTEDIDGLRFQVDVEERPDQQGTPRSQIIKYYPEYDVSGDTEHDREPTPPPTPSAGRRSRR